MARLSPGRLASRRHLAGRRLERAEKEGAGNRVRTDDLLITNQLLYQLSYAGVYEGKLISFAALSSVIVDAFCDTLFRIDVCNVPYRESAALIVQLSSFAKLIEDGVLPVRCGFNCSGPRAASMPAIGTMATPTLRHAEHGRATLVKDEHSKHGP